MTTPASEFRHIALDQLHESPYNPRRHYDAKSLGELADSIKAQGVLEPILVRANAKGFEIVAGSRRYRAAKKAGLAEIPALVRTLTDEQALEAAVVENLQRADIHPLDEAQGYQTLIDKTGLEVEAIAAKIGKSVSYVYQRLKLNALDKKVQAAFGEDKITAGHAILIARLQPKDQTEALEACTRGYSPLSVRGLTQWIDDEIHLDLHGAAFKKDDAQLVPKAGPCTTCPKRAGSQPELFPDIKKKDTCTDPACFKAKMEAHMASRLQALQADGQKVVKITGNWYDPAAKKQGILVAEQWIKAGNKKCEHLATGLIVDGHERGQTLAVCTERGKCKVHRDGLGQSAAPRSHGPTPAQKIAERKRKAREIAQQQAIAAIVARTTTIAHADLQRFAVAHIHEVWHERVKAIVNRRGWTAEARKQFGGWNYADLAAAKVRKMDAKTLAGFLIECVLVGRDSDKDLPAIAKSHRVNLAQLERAALADLTAKAKKAEAAKKTKAKRTKVRKPAKVKAVQTSAKNSPAPAKKAAKPKAKASAKPKPRKKAAAKKPK